MLDDVERTLRTEFMSNLARTSRRDAHEMMAEIFNNLDRNTESRFLAALEERNRDSAERIKALMFTFEDLSSSIRPASRPCCAGRQAEGPGPQGRRNPARPVLHQHVGTRRQDHARGHGGHGAGAACDVDEAQMYMVQVAKDLAARGEIVMAEGKAKTS